MMTAFSCERKRKQHDNAGAWQAESTRSNACFAVGHPCAEACGLNETSPAGRE